MKLCDAHKSLDVEDTCVLCNWIAAYLDTKIVSLEQELELLRKERSELAAKI